MKLEVCAVASELQRKEGTVLAMKMALHISMPKNTKGRAGRQTGQPCLTELSATLLKLLLGMMRQKQKLKICAVALAPRSKDLSALMHTMALDTSMQMN